MTVAEAINRYGEEAIRRLGDVDFAHVYVIPTGSLALDLALGVGGIPRSRITEIYGPYQSGKTTLCQHLVAECQKMGGVAAFIDAEHALDLHWAEVCGVCVDDLYLAQPDYGEQALGIMECLLDEMDLIIVDSVAALVPKSEFQGELGDAHMASQARMMSKALRMFTAKVRKGRAAVVFTNQLRMKIGVVFGSPEVTSGGEALKYYASVRLDLRKRALKKEGEEVTGHEVFARVVKNKVAPPYKNATLRIHESEGISLVFELIAFAQQLGFIEKAHGGRYTLFPETERMQKVHGEGRLIALLREDIELCSEIENRVRSEFGLPIDCSKGREKEDED